MSHYPADCKSEAEREAYDASTSEIQYQIENPQPPDTQETKAHTYIDLVSALKATRNQQGGIPLIEVATAINDVFSQEEIESLREYLQ